LTESVKGLLGPLAVAAILVVAVLFVHNRAPGTAEAAVELPAPVLDPADRSGALKTAVLAGGCFWGVQAVFQHTDGVVEAVSGYAGGSVARPTYRQVARGNTGHAETVAVRYDPARISYGKLLQIFFSIAHDPTQLNRQGGDIGTQYRSAIYTTTDEQKRVAEAYIEQLGAAGVYDRAIVTEIAPLKTFYPAEDYHQDYATLHPNRPYIVIHDRPKIENMRTMFPDYWREEPNLVFADGAG
jgi:peptide-methionine (S)-S-oxide reductase